MRALRLIALLGSCLFLMGGPWGAGADEAGAGRLQALRRAIEEHRERVGAFERQERSLLETVEDMDRAYDALARDARRARTEAREVRQRLDALEEEAGTLEDRVGATRAALAARAVALYKTGEPGPIAVLFSADSLSDLLFRMEALRLLLLHDRQLIDRFREQSARLGEARVEAGQAALERDRAAARLTERTRQQQRERAAKRKLLTDVGQDRTRERRALYELEAAARTLEETFARLGDAREPRSDANSEVAFESLRGRLESPVNARIDRPFGRVVDSEFRTETFRNGVDFEAGEGAEVQAVADGAVRFAGWFRGYGKLVILDHGDRYFTVSGHLGELEVEVGDRIRSGERIGTVGETGSLSGPRLYFEIRRGGEPLDPAEWLSGPLPANAE